MGFGSLSSQGIGGVRGALLDGEEKFMEEMLNRFTKQQELEMMPILDEPQLKRNTKAKYTLLESSQIEQEIIKRVNALAKEHKLTKTLAQMLLIKNDWDVEKIPNQLIENKDYIEKTFNFKVGQANA